MYVNIHTGFDALQGSLENGKFSKPEIINQRSQPLVVDVDMSKFFGKDVVILSSNKDQLLPLTDILKKGCFRSVDCKEINLDSEWGRLALKKLVENRSIIPVEPEYYIAKKIGDIRYQQRLDSFYLDRGTNSERTVHPIFSDNNRFNPETLAAYGWQYQPPVFENEDDVKATMTYKHFLDPDSNQVAEFLMDITAKDRIISLSIRDVGDRRLDRQMAGISGLEEHHSFPDGLVMCDPSELEPVNATIKSIKEIQETPIFALNTLNSKSCNAAVLKLLGRQTYLLTPVENKEVLQSITLPDSELFKCFMESWPEHVKTTCPEEFAKHTLPTLRRLLPEVDTNLKVIKGLIEELSTIVGHENNKFFKGDIQTLKARLIKFQSLYQELLITEKQMESHRCVRDKAQEEIDFSLKRPLSMSRLIDILSRIPGEMTLVSMLQEQYESMPPHIACDLDMYKIPLMISCIVDLKLKLQQKKETAELKLKELKRKIKEIRFDIDTQTELHSLLVDLASKLCGEIHDVDTCKTVDTKSLFEKLFDKVNTILGLISSHAILMSTAYSYNIEALSLAVDDKLSNNTETSLDSGLFTASQTMRGTSSTSEPRQQDHSEDLLSHTDFYHAVDYSVKRSNSLSALPTGDTPAFLSEFQG